MSRHNETKRKYATCKYSSFVPYLFKEVWWKSLKRAVDAFELQIPWTAIRRSVGLQICLLMLTYTPIAEATIIGIYCALQKTFDCYTVHRDKVATKVLRFDQSDRYY